MSMTSFAFYSCQLVVLSFSISIYESSCRLSLYELTHEVSLSNHNWLSILRLHFGSLTTAMHFGSFTQLLRLSLCLNFYTYLVLTFCFVRTSCIHYFYLVAVRVCQFIFCRRLHFEMSWFFFIRRVVINPGLIKVLIKVLYTVIIIRDRLSFWFFIWSCSRNYTLVGLLIKKFYECIIRHVFSRLNESFAL